MRFSVLINNYNYGRFLGQAIASVQAQTLDCSEIIVVDDGSLDESLKIAHNSAAQDSRITVISKENGGQLSAINAGFLASTGNVICFLDADDEYGPGWLARLKDVYTQNPIVDFVFCEQKKLGLSESELRARRAPVGNFDYGFTFYRTLLSGEWIGAPTSAISARRSLLERFLPCDLENHARLCADDVLVYGASIAMGRKYHIEDPLVGYRIHRQNSFYGRGPEKKFPDRNRRIQILAAMSRDFNLDGPMGIDLPRWVWREFSTIPEPRAADHRRYYRMLGATRGRQKLRRMLQLLVHWRLGGRGARKRTAHAKGSGPSDSGAA